jgi:hypothetical protein
MIHKRDSGEVMMDAAADLSFSRQPTLIRAPRAQAGNKLFYGTPVVLRAVGNWQC